MPGKGLFTQAMWVWQFCWAMWFQFLGDRKFSIEIASLGKITGPQRLCKVVFTQASKQLKLVTGNCDLRQTSLFKIALLSEIANPNCLCKPTIRQRLNSGRHDIQHNDTIDIESLQNRLLKFCYVPATRAGLPRVSFFFSFLFLLLWPLTVLMKQTRQMVCAVKQSIFLDVY